jgi:2-oxoglutarate dioxygenase / 2-oxoglutarate/L-arginine monooxygenase/decarboxylase
MQALMEQFGAVGEKLLRLLALGLASRGIGAHTDYGLLVIAAQDDVGGLYIRPPVPASGATANWLESESMAGTYGTRSPGPTCCRSRAS